MYSMRRTGINLNPTLNENNDMTVARDPYDNKKKERDTRAWIQSYSEIVKETGRNE